MHARELIVPTQCRPGRRWNMHALRQAHTDPPARLDRTRSLRADRSIVEEQEVVGAGTQWSSASPDRRRQTASAPRLGQICGQLGTGASRSRELQRKFARNSRPYENSQIGSGRRGRRDLADDVHRTSGIGDAAGQRR